MAAVQMVLALSVLGWVLRQWQTLVPTHQVVPQLALAVATLQTQAQPQRLMDIHGHRLT